MEAIDKKYKLPKLEYDPWVTITIVLHHEKDDGSTDWGKPGIILHQYDLPRDLYNRRSWVVQWRYCKLQCKYPKRYISRHHNYYDKRRGNVQLHDMISKFNSAKSQVTRVLRGIDILAEECRGSLFNRVEDHPKYPILERKLREKQDKLDELYNKLESEITLNT